MTTPTTLPPYIYGRETGPNEKVWSEQTVRALAARADALQAQVEALQARPAALPAGWQAVPVEPTPEMLLHAYKETGIARVELADHYRNLLSAAPSPPQQAEQGKGEPLEQAPAHSLPDWHACAVIIDNANFQQRAVAGQQRNVPNIRPTALHRFIHEYDDADPYRSAWFMHRLEQVVNEARAAPPLPAQEGWTKTAERRPNAGDWIVKRWKTGAVWAGQYSGTDKDSSFDEWCALPPTSKEGAA
jgi:hypothetical protein